MAAAVRKKENREKTEWILNYIEALPDNIEYINITGGEPTLAGEDLFKILESLKNNFSMRDISCLQMAEYLVI